MVPGSKRIHIEGFGTLDQAGAPAVPIRRERIALPEGASPVLRVLGSRTRVLGPLSLEPVPGPGDSSGLETPGGDPRPGSRRGAAYHRDPEVYGRDADYPSEVVRLGEIGRLRDQRYVDLLFTPVQVNPSRGTGRITEEIEIEIEFSGAASTSRPGRSDERFREVYEKAFRNGEQAERLRRGPSARTSREALSAQVESGVGTVYKMSLKQEGIYRISCASLPGCSVPDLIGQDPNTFRLRNKGVEVPMRVLGGSDNSFDLGDVLEFYGQPQKEPFTVLNCGSPTCVTPVYENNDITDVNVYLLDATASTARVRMSTVDGTPGGLTAEANFLETAHAEVNDWFLPLNDNDPYYWKYALNAGGDPTCGIIGSRCKDLGVPLPGLSSASFTASVRVRLRGSSFSDAANPDHRSQLSVNGGGTTISDWDGETIFDQTTSVSQSSLTDPSTVHMEALTLSGVTVSQFYVDFAEITYRRLFQAVSDRLAFNFPNQAAKFTTTGFSGGAVQPYDVSRFIAGTYDTREPRVVVNAASGAGAVTFQIAGEGPPTPASRRFLLVGPGGYLTPDSVAPMAANNLRDPTNEADYLIIAHPSLIDLAPGSPYQQFVTYLQTSLGLKTRLVFIGDVYDAFNDSLEHPEAIRSFLAYAHDQWTGPSGVSAPPAYVLFVGDAVWDFKNNLALSDWIDLVPTPIMFYYQSALKYYSSDNWLASFLGNDQSADILHGRIPARTSAQADTVFSKILAYRQSPPAGAWRSDGYFLADVGNDASETQTFEATEDQSASHFVSPWTQTKQYYAEPPYSAPTGGCNSSCPEQQQFRNDFISHWSGSHPVIASFTGHGAFNILGNDNFFGPADVPLLTNGAYQPFFYNSDCLTAGFHAMGSDSVGEAFLESGTGGAIGFFAPAGLSFTFIGSTVSDQLFTDLFSPLKFRELGTLTDRARDVLYQQGSIADMQGYTLLGEPSLELVLPAPKPPGSFSVTGGNGHVDASWTPSPDPQAVGTNLYRAVAPGGPYTKVNGAPVAGTAFTDNGVTNGTTYFYRAVSVDAAGFEGRVTNANSDCGVSGPPDGPHCRRAVPLNPFPPSAPQGVTAHDTGTGTSLDVSWLANPETDIQKYLVSYGTSSGSHPTVKNAGLATTFTITGLTAGVTYYVVVSAVNTSGLQSSPSSEVSGVPHVFFGIAPPRMIQDLQVNRSGNDLILTWGAVTTNIYGNPTVVNHYNVYRGNFPTFVPSDSINRIAQIPASPTPSFTHLGGATLADDGYYLVSALDNDGFASALGTELPSGILFLQVEPSPSPGMIRLSWPAVTTTITGRPTFINHYTLYGSTVPVPRKQISAANLLLDNLVGTSVDVPQPASSRFYYNLIVVDDRGNLSPY